MSALILIIVGWKQWITNFAKMPVFHPINFDLKFMQLAIASSSYLRNDLYKHSDLNLNYM